MTHRVAIANISNWPNDDIVIHREGLDSVVLVPGETWEHGTGKTMELAIEARVSPTGETGYRPWQVLTRPAAERGPDEPNRLLRWFAYEHLRPELAAVSREFADLAERMDALLPDGAEKTVALRKLLEGKDAAVRAALERLA